MTRGNESRTVIVSLNLEFAVTQYGEPSCGMGNVLLVNIEQFQVAASVQLLSDNTAKIKHRKVASKYDYFAVLQCYQ